ncbi:hypothetical protein SUGI_0320040 [Cryptomeria japonica]|nr:hypothetical protein SUGI_0320040 [Cryptomeria japonica]
MIDASVGTAFDSRTIEIKWRTTGLIPYWTLQQLILEDIQVTLPVQDSMAADLGGHIVDPCWTGVVANPVPCRQACAAPTAAVLDIGLTKGIEYFYIFSILENAHLSIQCSDNTRSLVAMDDI